MPDGSTQEAAVRDLPELRRRMAEGETLCYGLFPKESPKSRWFLRPSMTPVALSAIRAWRERGWSFKESE
jgi:hypothetical protein